MAENVLPSVELLATISSQLYWLIGILAVGILAQLARIVLQVRRELPRTRERQFEQRAEHLFEMGQYAELVQVCEERLGERPNSPMALWWSARAHFELEHYPFARERFARLLRIEPGWRDHVAPYMEKLQGRTHNVQ